MAIYVVSSWNMATTPTNESGEYIQISGRIAGITAFLLTLLSIAPRFSLRVSARHVHYDEASVFGPIRHTIPLSAVTGTFYGYRYPWVRGIVTGALLSSMITTIVFIVMVGILNPSKGSWTGLAGVSAMAPIIWFFGWIIITLIYVFLNKSMILGFKGGGDTVISFKRSVIEGQSIEEGDFVKMSSIIQTLVDVQRGEKS